MGKKSHIPPNSILKRLQEYFRLLCASSDEYYFVEDLKAGLTMLSPNMVTNLGLPGEVISNMDEVWTSIVHPNDVEGFLQKLHKNFTKDDHVHDAFYRVCDVRKKYIWVHCHGEVSFDSRTGEPNLFAGVIRQLGQKIQADANTGLLGKYQFEKAVKDALVKVNGEYLHGIIMILGIDNFKIINESYNRRYGNIMLRLAAEAIEKVIPDGIRLYKLDGDEFGLVLPGMDEEAANDIYDSIQKAFCHPHIIEGRSIFCTISAGSVAYPQGGKDYLVLHKHCEAALDQAKREGKNKNIVFSKEHYNRWLRSVNMRDMLHDSIENNYEGFSLFYQPQVDARTQKLIGAEALLRWRSPKGRMVSPMEFVRILEETKMIILVGRWIFETAVKQCKAWQEKWPGMRISINLSYEQIKERGFEDFAIECLKKYDVPPYLIILELTETAIVSDWNNVNAQFQRFRKLGMSIAMDDFGTGYSSLAYMKHLACDIVKIDRAFVVNIMNPQNEFDRHLVKATIELCHSVNIVCCIEGVEAEDEYLLLRDFCHADCIQGYYFGHPEPPEEFEKKFFVEQNPYLDLPE